MIKCTIRLQPMSATVSINSNSCNTSIVASRSDFPDNHVLTGSCSRLSDAGHTRRTITAVLEPDFFRTT